MRICSPQIRLDPGSNLGGVVYDRELLHALTEHGVEVEAPIMIMPDYATPIGLRLHHLGFDRSICGATLLLQPLFLKEMMRLHRLRPFDLVRVFNNRYAGLAALLFRLKTGVPTVVHYNHIDNNSWKDYLFDRLLIHHYDGIVTLSRFTRDQLCNKYRVPKQSISISYCGVGPQYQPAPRNESLLAKYELNGKLVLVTLSVIRRRKNLECLINAVASLRNSFPEIVLLICGSRYDGEPSYYDELLKRVNRLSLKEQIRFTGYVPEKEKPAYYNLADIFVFSSHMEGFGLAPVEAMACAKPVVVSNAGSLPEVVQNGVTGFLANPNDSAEFEAAISKMINLGTEGRLAMGQAARKWVSQFTWSAAAERALAAYKTIAYKRRFLRK